MAGGGGSPPTREGTASSAGPAPEASGVRDEGLDKRLNQVATTLIGATAGVSALFALLGANSERVWLILDDTNTKKLLAATTFFVSPPPQY